MNREIFRLTFGKACTPAASWLVHEFEHAYTAARFTADLIRAINGGTESDATNPSLWALDAGRPRVSLTGGPYHFTLELI